MKLNDLKKPMTANALNESLAKTFGTKLALNKFTNEQLEDARNRLRTQLSQVETSEKFESVLSSDTYQKTKMFLDVINQEVLEREVKEAKPDFLDLDKDGDKKEPMKKAAKEKGDSKDSDSKGLSAKQKKLPAGLQKAIAGKKKTNEAEEEGKMPSKAHIMKMCKDGKSAEEICKMHPDCDPAKIKAMIKDCKSEMNEALDKLIEGAEEAATLVMAAKDMVDRVTGWMEDTAEMQTESMLELGDKIRDELGSEASEQFIGTVKPALENLYTVFETTREALTGGVAIVTGEGAPATMGAEDPAMDPEADPAMEPTVDADADVDAPVDDEFGASEPATGGDEVADRAKRESIKRSRRLASILTDSKKKAPTQKK
tara:strand:- start:685 stop:1800 length:1116 start_codon:yes stop_codon:yes gene_type:complete